MKDRISGIGVIASCRLLTRIAVLFLCGLPLTGCTERSEYRIGENAMRHAELLAMSDSAGHICAHIANPWKRGRLLCRYHICSTASTGCDDLKGNGYTVCGTFKRVIVTSNCHAKLLSTLGLDSCIAGVCESEYITDSVILKGIRDGRIADCGNSMHPDIEKIIELSPDAFMVTPFEESGLGQLEKLDIPFIECADYMETSPLGRAEWMRFYGRLFNAAEKADSMFRAIETRYDSLKEIVSQTVSRPVVMVDLKGSSAWYVPGGNSTVGHLIEDAGGNYIFSDIRKNGSVPQSFETVFDKGSESDIWLLKNSTTKPLTYRLLEKDCSYYSHFRPFAEHNIWVCDVMDVPYFEETAFHPDLLLEEMISIFHPETGAAGGRYYHPLEQ